jgi:hypothetical protein
MNMTQMNWPEAIGMYGLLILSFGKNGGFIALAALLIALGMMIFG